MVVPSTLHTHHTLRTSTRALTPGRVAPSLCALAGLAASGLRIVGGRAVTVNEKSVFLVIFKEPVRGYSSVSYSLFLLVMSEWRSVSHPFSRTS